MSVTYRACQYDEEVMGEEFRKRMGIDGGAFGQIASEMDHEEEREIITQADTFTFGDSYYELPQKLNNLFSGLTPVTDELIRAVESLINSHDTSEMRRDPYEFRDWLVERKGEKVFTESL